MEHLDTIAILGGIIFYVYNKIMERRAKRKHSVESGSRLNDAIYPRLWRILLEYKGAMRVNITQFHNGEAYYTGLSIQRETMTHEVCHPGINGTKLLFDNRLISNTMHQVVKQMWLSGWWGYEDRDNIVLAMDDMATTELKEFAKIHDIRSAYYFRITDKNKQTVGALQVHFRNRQPLDAISIENLKNQAKMFENTFADAR